MAATEVRGARRPSFVHWPPMQQCAGGGGRWAAGQVLLPGKAARQRLAGSQSCTGAMQLWLRPWAVIVSMKLHRPRIAAGGHVVAKCRSLTSNGAAQAYYASSRVPRVPLQLRCAARRRWAACRTCLLARQTGRGWLARCTHQRARRTLLEARAVVNETAPTFGAPASRGALSVVATCPRHLQWAGGALPGWSGRGCAGAQVCCPAVPGRRAQAASSAWRINNQCAAGGQHMPEKLGGCSAT